MNGQIVLDGPYLYRGNAPYVDYVDSLVTCTVSPTETPSGTANSITTTGFVAGAAAGAASGAGTWGCGGRNIVQKSGVK